MKESDDLEKMLLDINDPNRTIQKMSLIERHQMLLEQEQLIDLLLATGQIDLETAWDCYFALLYECAESEFRADHERILGKIDTRIYNPFLSKDPSIVMLARLRQKRIEEDGKE